MDQALIIMGSDHAGFPLKEILKKHLASRGFQVDDTGPHSQESCDYPPFAANVAQKVLQIKGLGILICGSGLGMSMAANRYPGIRAALCTNEYMARLSRLHNNANILCLGQRVIGEDLAKSILDVFLDTPFEGGRHQRRIDLFDHPGQAGC